MLGSRSDTLCCQLTFSLRQTVLTTLRYSQRSAGCCSLVQQGSCSCRVSAPTGHGSYCNLKHALASKRQHGNDFERTAAQVCIL